MSETFGAYGWGLTLEQMKEVTNWHAVSGVDHEVLHAFYYSIEGPRKRESPPDLFYHQVWKDDFHMFSEYARRVLYLAACGEHVVDVAVFYPTTAIMTEGGINDFAPFAMMEEYLLTCSLAVRAGQFDFNYVDELAIGKHPDVGVPVEVHAGELRVGDHNYSIVILTDVPAISGAAAETLAEFYGGGGTIIAVGSLPVRVTDGKRDSLDAFLEAAFGTIEASPGSPIEKANDAGGRGVYIPIPGKLEPHQLPRNPVNITTISMGRDPDFSQGWIRQLVDAVGRSAFRDVEIASFLNPNISFLHKRGEGKEWYLIVNDAREAVREDFTFSCSGIPSLWEPETGQIQEALVYRQAGERTTVPLRVPPFGAIGVVFDSRTPARVAPHLTHSDAEVLRSEASEDGLKFAVLTEHEGPVTVMAIRAGRSMTRTLSQADGLEPAPVDGEWNFHLEGIEESRAPRGLGSWTDKWPQYSGTGWYEKEIAIEAGWLNPDRKLYLDLGDVRNIAQVRVNGRDAGIRLWRPYRLDITALLKSGTNRLEVGVTNTLANRYTQGRPGLQENPDSGLLGPVRLVAAKVLEGEITWK
jgi:hypothetical protein